MTKGILCIIGLLVAGGVFFFYTKPTYDGIHGLQAQIQQYNQALTKAAELQQLKQTLLSRYNAFNPTDLDRLHKFLPDHVDNVRLLLDLDNMASRHGMALANVNISAPGTANPNTTAIGTITAGSKKYDSLTFTFGTEGTYQTFIEFMNDLESSLRVVELMSLTLDSANGTLTQVPAAGSDPVYRFKLTLRTYWLK